MRPIGFAVGLRLEQRHGGAPIERRRTPKGKRTSFWTALDEVVKKLCFPQRRWDVLRLGVEGSGGGVGEIFEKGQLTQGSEVRAKVDELGVCNQYPTSSVTANGD